MADISENLSKILKIAESMARLSKRRIEEQDAEVIEEWSWDLKAAVEDIKKGAK